MGALERAGPNPFRWGGPHLAWGSQADLEATPVFVLDDVEEQDFWDRARVVRWRFTRTMSLALSALNANLGEIGQVCHILFGYLPILLSCFRLALSSTPCVGALRQELGQVGVHPPRTGDVGAPGRRGTEDHHR